MNFDELKKQWDNQSVDNLQIEIDLNKQMEVNSIIDNVRKVMKKDFFFQLTSFPMLLLYPYLFEVNTPIMWFVVFCYVVIMIVPLKSLVRFYQQSYKMEYNSTKNLNWFYYNYKFSIQLFKIYSYITFVLVVMFIGIVFLEKISLDSNKKALFTVVILSIALTVFVFLCIWLTNWWVRKFYTKPLKEIENVLQELEN